MLMYLSLTLLGLVICLVLFDTFSRNGRLIRKIPGPKSWPIIGNSMGLLVPPEKLFTYMRYLTKEYGHINQIHAMNIRMVNISNPDDLEVLSSPSQHIVKGDIYKLAAPWFGDGLAMSGGEKWHRRRKMLTKAFHFNILKKFMVTFKEETEEFLKCIQEETVNKQTDLLAILSPAMLRIICETAMGTALREDKSAFNKYFKSIQTMGECIISRVFNVWLYNDYIFNLTETAKTQKRVLSHLHGFTNQVINDRRRKLEGQTKNNEFDDDTISVDGNNKIALLDLLLQNEKNGSIDVEGIREEVDTFTFAGHDTTSITLSFFLMAIANEPTIQDKIYEEVKHILGDTNRLPTMDELNAMNYLDRCIKESLRLYPSAPFIAKQILQDTVMSGYTVPAGTLCLLQIYDLHHRPDIFPDPERFDPDRFLPENCLKRHAYSYIPFSAGPRNCIGQKFAMLEMKMLLAGLLMRFRVEPVTRPSDIVYKTLMLLHTKDPLYVRFTSRY